MADPNKDLVEFRDVYGMPCRLLRYHHLSPDRMQLRGGLITRDNAAMIWPLLKQFAETGRFDEPEPPAEPSR